MDALEEGTKYLEEGNVEAARDHYKRSVGIQKSAAALFNLGVSAVLYDPIEWRFLTYTSPYRSPSIIYVRHPSA
jgi:hypothetical protein